VADGEVLFQRFKERATLGERHPGHVETLNLEEFKPALLRGRDEVLEIGGMVIEVDMTDFGRVDYEGLVEEIRFVLCSGKE
jgi:hypothetical protein